jgi:hypothetical protein
MDSKRAVLPNVKKKKETFILVWLWESLIRSVAKEGVANAIEVAFSFHFPMTSEERVRDPPTWSSPLLIGTICLNIFWEKYFDINIYEFD